MITIRDLTHHLPHERVRETVVRYARARRLMEALLVVEAERAASGEPALPEVALTAADEAMDACRQVIAPAVALAEGAVTRTELALQLARTDRSCPGQRADLMQWISNRRSQTITLDQVLDHAIIELGVEDAVLPLH